MGSPRIVTLVRDNRLASVAASFFRPKTRTGAKRLRSDDPSRHTLLLTLGAALSLLGLICIGAGLTLH
jgi:hypothetical protein